MSAISLRPAEPADAAAIGALHVAAWRETYVGLLPDALLAELSVDARVLMWGKVLADPGAFGTTALFVAEAEGAIVGFGACGPQRDAALAESGYGGEIGAVYVLRAHQGRGAGRALLAALADALNAAGHAAASLWVLRGNRQARAFYEAMGGLRVGKKTEAGPHGTRIEIAYGWRNLAGAFGPRQQE